MTNLGTESYLDSLTPPPPARPCACGCGGNVYGLTIYQRGHDARHRDRLIDLMVGRGNARQRADRINQWIAAFEARP